MKLKICIPFLVILLFVLTSTSFSQLMDGEYSVGKTSCTIESAGPTLSVYWKDGVGSTKLNFSEELPNGNLVYDEYDGDTWTGQFIFKNSTFNSGIYERADGKRFNLKRR